MRTRTGNFPIGFRRLRFSPWQRDLPSLLTWAKHNNFTHIDLGPDADIHAQEILTAGLAIGSADLPDWQTLFSPDSSRRTSSIQKSTDYIHACATFGIRNFFIVILPENPEAPRSENLQIALQTLNALAAPLSEHNSHLVIEGWPGPGALCCTPETLRPAFEATPNCIGFNYDPSHLVRMNIDPLRFLEEFAPRIYHVHAKDTELLTENLYTLGSEQPATFAKPRNFGWTTWRYCIPGKGHVSWSPTFERLAAHGYKGAVSIELEDDQYNGSVSGEKQGLIDAAGFLSAS